MAVPIRKPPGVEDAQNFRALEAFHHELYQHLRLVGTTTVDLGSLSAGAVATFTITVTGCKADQQQSVAVAAPSALEAGLVFCGVVTDTNEVTVRVHNTTGSPIDPAEAVWGARVLL